MRPLVLLIPDLYFSVKVADTARSLGYPTRDVANAAALVAVAKSGVSGIVLDTQERSDWQSAIRALKADPATAGLPVLAFGSHVDVDASRAAVAVGCDRLVTRGKLSRELPDLLRSLVEPSVQQS